MNFSEKQKNVAKLLTKISTVYQNYFLSDNIFRTQFENGYKALICFLDNYAYERQGAPKAYPKIAIKCISNKYKKGENWIIPTETDVKNLWEDYRNIAISDFNMLSKNSEEAKVNKRNNPMNKNGGVINKLNSLKIPNIAVYVRDLLCDSNIAKAYKFLINIRGVGEKISSFYLRDIAYLSNLEENDIKEDLYLLQPIDTWLEQTLKVLFNNEFPNSLQDKQKKIVKLCEESEVSSISFNQGAWVLGSQIAGEFESFKRAINSNNSAKNIIKKHIEDKELYLIKVQDVLNMLSNL